MDQNMLSLLCLLTFVRATASPRFVSHTAHDKDSFSKRALNTGAFPTHLDSSILSKGGFRLRPPDPPTPGPAVTVEPFQRRPLPAFLQGVRYVCAPMVDCSELAFRMLVRRHGADLCYTPMIRASTFLERPSEREYWFQTCPEDRPLIAQFCGDDKDILLSAAKLVQHSCDAIDLNLGCPTEGAKAHHFGAFLASDRDLVFQIVSHLSAHLEVPLTCKIRLQSSEEETIHFAKLIESAGCSMLVVHGRTIDQKSHVGFCDWKQVRAVREALRIPVIANGNCWSLADADRCLEETGCCAVMCASALLENPYLFTGVIDGFHSNTGDDNAAGVELWERRLAAAREYLQCAQDWAPTDPIYTRQHLKRMLRPVLMPSLKGLPYGVLAQRKEHDHIDLWDCLNQDFMMHHVQFEKLLDAIEHRLATLSGSTVAKPVLTLGQIKRMTFEGVSSVTLRSSSRSIRMRCRR